MSQSRIPVPDPKRPEPSDHECEWCSEQAAVAVERREGKKNLPTQQYVFACSRHEEIARKVARNPKMDRTGGF